MSDDDWVQAAMADDSLVADLLLFLRAAGIFPLQQSLSTDWRVRQRRSKPTADSKKISTSTVSPSTPLSWSGETATESAAAASASAVDGFEESSRPTDSARSKQAININVNGGGMPVPSTKTMTKKKELAAVDISLEKIQRAANQSLKSLKVDIEGAERRDSGGGGSFLLPDLNIALEDNFM